MTYGIGIGFPIEPTKEDVKKLKRELAHDRFEVISGGKSGGKTKSKPTAKRTGGNKTESTGEKN